MKCFPTLLLAFLVASSALAVIDPDPDMMGIYFDTSADQNCLTVGTLTPFYAYVILTNPTLPVIDAYEFELRIVVPEGMVGQIFRLNQYQYFGHGPCFPYGFDHPVGDFIVGLGAPYPTSLSTPLHVLQYLLLDNISVEMYPATGFRLAKTHQFR